MKNFVQAGSNLTIPTPHAVTAGHGVKLGGIFGVAVGSAASGSTVDIATFGVYDLAKVTAETFAIGAAVYWDDSEGLVTSTATDNTKIGVAVAVAGNPSASVKVRLNGTF